MIPFVWKDYYADEDDYLDARLEYKKPEYHEEGKEECEYQEGHYDDTEGDDSEIEITKDKEAAGRWIEDLNG